MYLGQRKMVNYHFSDAGDCRRDRIPQMGEVDLNGFRPSRLFPNEVAHPFNL